MRLRCCGQFSLRSCTTPGDTTERSDDARWRAASTLIDEVCGVGGNALAVGDMTGGGDRIDYARYLPAASACRT